MNKKIFPSFFIILIMALSYSACDKPETNDPTDPCAGVTISVTANVTNAGVGQSNGAISATASGASSFTFSIDGGAFQSSGNFTGLAAGAHTVTAKSSEGCTGTGSFTVGTNNPCAGITVLVTGTVTNATTGQSNGSITVSATGGTGFTFSKDGTNFQASGTFTGLAAGPYTITAKNSNNCTGTAQFTVGTSNPCAGVTINVTTSITNATAGQSNGSITVTATGSTGFTYSINGTTFQASNVFNNLAAATYSVVAKDAAGCTGTAQAVVGTTNPCAGVTITVNTTTTTATPCTSPPNGSINATASGSSGFTFSLNGGPFQMSGIFNNLSVANYSITARDLNGCTGTTNVSVTGTPAGPLFTNVRNILQANCALSGCHNAITQQNGINFGNDCDIVAQRDRIKVRAVDQAGTGSQMPPPPNPTLSVADRQAITNWVNAGGRYSD